MIATYTVELLPAIRPDETEWLVTGGREPYTVRRNARGEYRCTCPNHKFQRGSRARAGYQCKHVMRVLDSIHADELIQEAIAC